MTEAGPTPPDWAQWLNTASEQGLNLLRSMTAPMGAPFDSDSSAPIFVEAWQQALNDNAQPPDPETAALRFSEALEQALEQMQRGTEAGLAAAKTVLEGMREAPRNPDGVADWLGTAYRTARSSTATPLAWEDIHEAFHAFCEALLSYQREYTRSVKAAAGAFDEALKARQRAGDPPSSLDALHTLWIESAEPAYEDVLNSDSYSRAFAHFQNALTGLGTALRGHLQPMLKAFGVPTREEMESVLDRLAELRVQQARNIRLEAQVTTLKRELSDLKNEVAALRDNPTRS